MRMWEGDARSCAIGPDGAWYVGSEPAMIHRSDDRGANWTRCDAIDSLPTRGEWTFPPPPHEPHVLSIDFLPDEPDTVLAGIEVGGVILSRDRGETWQECNDGVYVDVHSVRPDPSRPGRLVAVTGAGFHASEDGGQHWQKRMEGIADWYTVGLAVDPERGDILVAAGNRPPGLNARLYHSADGGGAWQTVEDAALPEVSHRAPVPFFTAGFAWLGTDTGALLRSPDGLGGWEPVAELPAPVTCFASDGRSSSVMH